MMRMIVLTAGTVLLFIAGVFVAPQLTSARNIGDVCASHAECNDGIGRCGAQGCFCDSSEPPAICMARLPAGGSCRGIGNPACQADLVCSPVSGECARPGGEGGAPGVAAPARCPCSCETPEGGASIGMRTPDECRADCRVRGGTPVCPPDIPPGGAAAAPDGGAAGPVQGPAKYQQGEVCKDCDLTKINPLGTTSIPTILGRLINAFLGIMGSLALAVFVYGGFTWLTSAGNPEKITKGRNILIWAALGIVVVFAAYTLVNFVLTRLIGVL